MPRPRKCCYIAQPPAVAGMRPVGGDSVAPEAVTLRYDEYEAIRLIDHQGLTQAAAAERMGISRPTCTRPPHARRRARRRAAAAHRRRKGLPLRTLVPLPALPAHPHRNTPLSGLPPQ